MSLSEQLEKVLCTTCFFLIVRASFSSNVLFTDTDVWLCHVFPSPPAAPRGGSTTRGEQTVSGRRRGSHGLAPGSHASVYCTSWDFMGLLTAEWDIENRCENVPLRPFFSNTVSIRCSVTRSVFIILNRLTDCALRTNSVGWDLKLRCGHIGSGLPTHHHKSSPAVAELHSGGDARRRPSAALRSTHSVEFPSIGQISARTHQSRVFSVSASPPLCQWVIDHRRRCTWTRFSRLCDCEPQRASESSFNTFHRWSVVFGTRLCWSGGKALLGWLNFRHLEKISNTSTCDINMKKAFLTEALVFVR